MSQDLNQKAVVTNMQYITEYDQLSLAHYCIETWDNQERDTECSQPYNNCQSNP